MIEVRGLQVSLGDFTLKDITVSVARGEYFVVLGPTGAGKTVLLESIAGLNPIDSGEIVVQGRNMSGLDPEERHISIVYQDCALFPHYSVRDNIAFGLKMRKERQPELAKRVGEVVDLLGIGHLLQRWPETLSGGEKQKVALARAIATEPGVLLLDEPLRALDPETREDIQEELLEMQRSTGITVMHVTHDFEEAMAMADRIAVMGEGSVCQIGTQDDIFRRPGSAFVARFVMTRNIFTGKADEAENDLTRFSQDGLQVYSSGKLTGRCHASIRPEDIVVTTEAGDATRENLLSATVTRIVNRGATLLVTCEVPPAVTCMMTRYHAESIGLKVGQQIYITFPPSSLHLFPQT